MEKQRGIWIDHRKAMIVDPVNGKSRYTTLYSALNDNEPERPYRESHRNPEKKLQAKKAKILQDYYDNVINSLDDESELYIFGPAEAKVELQKKISDSHKKLRCVTVESSEKMTDNQVVAKVRDYFKARQEVHNN